ncbi:hypothetical protein KC338_g93 [Hortaea werneckii]|nr:hypothetical protein KC338_g93 [Hortaea werneckii]
MSIFTLLPANKVEDANLIFLGGLLILTLGVLYIAFEKSLIASAAPSGSGLSAPKADGLSRSILGVQVGPSRACRLLHRPYQAPAAVTLKETSLSASPRGHDSMDRDPFANAVLPGPSQVPPARVRRCSTRNDPNASRDLKYWHDHGPMAFASHFVLGCLVPALAIAKESDSTQVKDGTWPPSLTSTSRGSRCFWPSSESHQP